MQPDESIKEMFTCFTDITNYLNSLSKSYTNEKMVRKILRCLPKNKWGPKVIAIEEAQNLQTLAQDDLLGKLMTHEIHIKEDEEVVQTKKGVALKTANEDLLSSEDQSSEEDEDSMIMIATRLKKLLNSKRFDPKKLYKKGSSSKKNEKFAKGTKVSNNNKIESNTGPWFGCGVPGHTAKNCPILQKKAEKRKEKAKQEFKRAMIDAWSDSNSSDSENEEE